jgi:hypothetical protein
MNANPPIPHPMGLVTLRARPPCRTPAAAGQDLAAGPAVGGRATTILACITSTDVAVDVGTSAERAGASSSPACAPAT